MTDPLILDVRDPSGAAFRADVLAGRRIRRPLRSRLPSGSKPAVGDRGGSCGWGAAESGWALASRTTPCEPA